MIAEVTEGIRIDKAPRTDTARPRRATRQFAGLLHDVREKTAATRAELQRRFGAHIARPVESVGWRRIAVKLARPHGSNGFA